MPEILTSDGVRLWASDDGSGPPVVLVAGYTAPAASWAFQVDALIGAGYRAIGLDRRSHGRSEAPSYGQRMARHGKDLHDALRQLDLGPVGAGRRLDGREHDLGVRRPVRHGRRPRDRQRRPDPENDQHDDWPYGFYGLTPDNSGTFFAAGRTATGRGRTVDPASPALQRLVQRVGVEGLPGPPPPRRPSRCCTTTPSRTGAT